MIPWGKEEKAHFKDLEPETQEGQVIWSLRINFQCQKGQDMVFNIDLKSLCSCCYECVVIILLKKTQDKLSVWVPKDLYDRFQPLLWTFSFLKQSHPFSQTDA